MEVDKSNMRQVIIDSPKQLEGGLRLAKDVKGEGKFKNVIICGMGGSALPADILKTLNWIDKIYIHKDYGLPAIATQDSLIICISYSGNTEEVVLALREAVNKNFKVIGVASGGEIEKICQQNNVPFVLLTSGIQPRSAIGYIFSVLVKILENSGLVKDRSPEISDCQEKLGQITEELEKEGSKLAKKIGDKIPIIYAEGKEGAISMASLWKIKFNENTKIPAFYNYFPELNHNEMAGFSHANKSNIFHFVIIKDAQGNPRNIERMDIFADLMKKLGSNTDFVEVKGGSPIFKIFSTLLLGDWVSYYLALENNIDPTPVKIVEDFKKLLK